MSESRIMHDIRAALNTAVDADGRYVCRVLRNSVGYDERTRVTYGLGRGSPDLIGCLRNGRVLAIEVKSATGRLSPEQSCWWVAYRKWNGLGGVAHSVAEALALLAEALNVSV